MKQGGGEGGFTSAHIVEVTGPILPCHTENLVTLFHKTQAQDFGMVFNNHDPTVAFNVLPTVVKCGNECSLNSVKLEESKANNSITNSSQDVADEKEGKHESNPATDNENKPALTILDTLDAQNEHVVDKKDDFLPDKLLKLHPISEKVCAIKELVSTIDGFLWKS